MKATTTTTVEITEDETRQAVIFWLAQKHGLNFTCNQLIPQTKDDGRGDYMNDGYKISVETELPKKKRP